MVYPMQRGLLRAQRTSRRGIPRGSALLALALAASVLGGVSVPGGLQAKEKDESSEKDEVDHVALAAKLIKDGHFERARIVLDQVDPKQPELDLPRFHTLRGLVALEQKHFAPARQSFEKAIAAGQQQPVVYLYLAQAHFGEKSYAKVLEALGRAGTAGQDIPGTFMMRSQSHWELKQPAQALQALVAGQRAFPKEPEFTRIRIFYLIELGLFQEVARVGAEYLARPGVSADDYAAVGEGLRRSKQLVEARDVLEAAHLRFPGDEKLLVLLAHVYLDEGRPLVAAMLFEDASRMNPKYALESAELYLRAGRLERALALNSRVADQAAKMKQRLSILLELERHETIAAMAPRLSRLGLLEDENVRYALAYGYFRSGELEEAEKQLRHIRDPRLFESALQLRRAMDSCEKAGWECY